MPLKASQEAEEERAHMPFSLAAALLAARLLFFFKSNLDDILEKHAFQPAVFNFVSRPTRFGYIRSAS